MKKKEKKNSTHPTSLGGLSLGKKIVRQRQLLYMTVPFIIWAFIFSYLPLAGWVMAFQDFKLKRSLSESFFTAPFVGFKHFELLFQDLADKGRFFLALRNTLAMSLLALVFGFVIPVIFAIFLNEIRLRSFKRVVQTISYLPHFISWVVAAGMISVMLSSEGPINNLLVSLGWVEQRVAFLAEPKLFWGIITISDIWKEMGWNAIIFLAAITGVDMSLYESAAIDGAGRFRRIWHVTLPSIAPVIMVVLIMEVGWIISIGFEKQYLLGSDLVRNYSEVLDVYVLRYGIGQSRYSFGTAIGMFKSIISVILVLVVNRVVKFTGQDTIL